MSDLPVAFMNQRHLFVERRAVEQPDSELVLSHLSLEFTQVKGLSHWAKRYHKSREKERNKAKRERKMNDEEYKKHADDSKVTMVSFIAESMKERRAWAVK